PAIQLVGSEKSARFVKVGVPHLVVLVDRGLSELDVEGGGRALRNDPAFLPDGANVSFVERGPDGWSLRTYDRGVEAETLACGTGSVAVASVLVESGLAQLPVEMTTVSGCTMKVGGTAVPGGIKNATLVGEGKLVFRAILGL